MELQNISNSTNMNVKRMKSIKEQIIRYVNTDNVFATYISQNRARLTKDNPVIYVEEREEAIKILNQKDITKLLGIKVGINKEFSCPITTSAKNKKVVAFRVEEKETIVQEHMDWEKISEKENVCGHCIFEFKKKDDNAEPVAKIVVMQDVYYYCVKFQENKDKLFDLRLGIVDIWEIANKCDYTIAIRELCKLYNIKVKEFEDVEEICNYNQELLKGEDFLKTKYPYLYKVLLQRNTDKLEAFYEIYLSKIGKGNGDGLYILPEDVGEKVERKRQTLNPFIKCFAIVGLITIVDSKTYINTKGRKVLGYHYTIPKYDEVILKKANDMCESIQEYFRKLRKECPDDSDKFQISKMKEKFCEEIFGQEFTKKIYHKMREK